MPAIIRTLWGAETPISRWAKLARTDIPKATVHSRAEHYVYVYGRANADLLAKFGHKNVVLIDPEPWPDGREDVQRSAGNDYYRPWHYKWQLILRAMRDHGEVIYCDWDVFCMEPDVPAVFAKLEGRPLDYTLSMNCYMRPQPMTWRTGKELGTWRYCVGGFWVHLRTPAFAERVLAKINPDPKSDSWHDEHVMSRMIDDQHGGDWPGLDVWLERYESPIMVSPTKRSPWRIVSDDGRFIVRDTPVPFKWERIFRAR
jgi:hypothetical protein